MTGLKPKKYLLNEWVLSLVFCTLFYLPAIAHQSGGSAWFLNFGDVQKLWLPQVWMSILNIHHNIYTGIDFYTNNFAEDFFLKPNLQTYFPVTILLGYLFHSSNYEIFKIVFFWVYYYTFSFLCFVFTVKLARDFLKLGFAPACFLAVAYTFSDRVVWNSVFTPFIDLLCLFPLCLYISFYSVQKKNVLISFLVSIIPFSSFLAGYIPLSMMSFFLVVIFGCCYLHLTCQAPSSIKNNLYWYLLPNFISGVFVLPYYLALSYYGSYTGAHTFNIQGSAYYMGNDPTNILSFLSTWLPKQQTNEQPFLGVFIYTVILLLSLFMYTPGYFNNSENFLKKLALLTTAIFLSILFLCFGQFSILSSIFYHFLPGIGWMHIYPRFLIFGDFFNLILITILLIKLIDHAHTPRFIFINKCFIFLIIAILLAAAAYNQVLSDSYEYFAFELIATLFSLLAIMLLRESSFYLIIPLLFIALANFNYSQSNLLGQAATPSIIESPETTNQLISFFNGNSSKALIKYADLTATIPSYIPRNFPYLVANRTKLDNYYGYDLDTGIDMGYKQRFTYYGQNDFEWYQQTGCDFFIFDQDYYKQNQAQLMPLINLNDALMLPNNIMVVKTAFKNNPAPNFDNGLIQLFTNPQSAFILDNFKTNYATFISFDLSLPNNANIVLPFWPNRLLHLKINGHKEKMIFNNNGLYTFSLPPGDYQIHIYYSNFLLTVFSYIYRIYFILIILGLGLFIFCKNKKRLYEFK